MSKRTNKIEKLLTEALAPESLQVTDDSHKHVGHGGYHEGGSHFSVTLASKSFHSLDTLSRHRLIYDALGDMMQKEIHALTIIACTPDEI
ncbi:MAG: BolA family protein [Acidiferrobacterales bacterium]